MSHRRLAALRALAERPGTPAEGAVAREMLARAEAKKREQYPTEERSRWELFEEYLRTGDLETLRRAVREAVTTP